ncbi:MAG TPA: hypothetical protein VGO78_11885 [Acidimicrobiales bacterium]|jgi:hypothetical protein|nr:hypothetical protein [Acidimicrobiales bacterium]
MLLAALGAALGMLIVLAQPAAAAGVSNPGNFGATVLAGSSLTLSGGTAFGIGVPACSDGVDNDLAGGTDFPADTSCTAANDANERLAGLQVYVQPKVNTAVSGTGVINLAIAGYVFPPGEICVAAIGTWCLNATIAGDGATVGSINPEGPTAAAGDGTISLPVDLRVELDAVVGFPGLSANCRILPATATLASANYNKTTGNATLTNGAAVAVPAVAGCGSFLGLSYDTLINGQLGLPGTANASLLVQIRNAANQPVLP